MLLKKIAALFPQWFSQPSLQAIQYIFLIAGIGLATWLSRVPDLRHALGLSDTKTGFLFLGQELCGLIAMQIVSWLIPNYGKLRYTLCSIVLFVIAVSIPGAASNYTILVIGACLLGMGFGALDIAMNARADIQEKTYHKRILGFCHAFFSLGCVLGALASVGFVHVGVSMTLHFSFIAIVLTFLGTIAWAKLPTVPLEQRKARFSISLPTKELALIAYIAFACAIAETAITSWSGIYLRDVLQAGDSSVAAFYGVFAAGMFSGRVQLEYWVRHLGIQRVMQTGAIIAIVGYGWFLSSAFFSLPIMVAMVGLYISGVGLSSIYPLFVRRAGQYRGNAARNMAAVVTVAYCGYVLGAPVVGILTSFTALWFALLLVPVCFVGIAVLVKKI